MNAFIILILLHSPAGKQQARRHSFIRTYTYRISPQLSLVPFFVFSRKHPAHVSVMKPPIAVSSASTLERLPWECYLLRGALDADAQRDVAERVGKLAAGGFPTWPEVASKQDHPIIITSHSANAKRSRECRRACGLAKCMGHCGRHVGALVERPDDIYRLANDVAAKIAKDLGTAGFAMDFPRAGTRGDTSAVGDEPSSGETRARPFEATHFWGLVYGARDDAPLTTASADAEAEEPKFPKRIRSPRREELSENNRAPNHGNVTFGGVSVLSGTRSVATHRTRDGHPFPGSGPIPKNPDSGRMSSHLDRPVGWTLSVSLGRSARFNLGRPPAKDAAMYGDFSAGRAAPGQTAPGLDVLVNSGDALLFRGHAVFHAVDGLCEASETSGVQTESERRRGKLPNPAEGPLDVLRNANGTRRPARVSLLFRHETDAIPFVRARVPAP
jgi:hypothetical protein